MLKKVTSIFLIALALALSCAEAKAAPKQYGPNQYSAIEGDPDEATSKDDYFHGNPVLLGNELFFGGGLNYFDNFGFQGRYAARIIKNNLIRDITNSFYIEGGLGLTFYGTKADQTSVTGLSAVITGRWDFQMNSVFTFFGDLGFGYNAVSNDRKNDVHGGGAFPAIGVGAIASFTDDWAARADISYQFFGFGVVRRF